MAVEVLLGHSQVLCLRDMPLVTEIQEPIDRRGTEINIWYQCEAGHKFKVRQTFRKGNIECSIEKQPTDPHVVLGFLNELWRN